MFERLKRWALQLKRDVLALSLAARDPRVPWYAKTLAGLVAAYALSPIDLIPDFVPVLGYLDDLLLVPLGIWLAVKLVPAEVMSDLRERALGSAKPDSRSGLWAVVLVWAVMVLAASWLLAPVIYKVLVANGAKSVRFWW